MNMITRRRMLMIHSSHGSVLPDEYQEVQWLRGTGTQYCETAFSPYYDSNTFIGISCDLTVLNFTTSEVRIDCRIPTNNQNYGFALSASGQKNLTIRYPNSGTGFNLSSYDVPFDIHALLKQNICSVNNQIESIEPVQFTTADKILIGAYQGTFGIVPWNTDTLIKKVTIYDNDDIVSEIIPCTRKSDGKAGFYQTNVPTGYDNFIYNLGSGSDWLVGPNV